MTFRKIRQKTISTDRHLSVVKIFFFLFALALVGRLFVLQVLKHNYYLALAEGRHSLSREIEADRGRILLSDIKKPGELFPLALDKDVFNIIADPKTVQDPEKTARLLAKKLNLDQKEILAKLKNNSRYEIIKKQVEGGLMEELKLENLAGISFERHPFRFYPEKEIGSQLTGFYGLNAEGEGIGRYGLEGYFDELLAGEPGYEMGERDAAGGWLALTEKQTKEAKNGADLVLTIDRTIEYVACQKLEEGMAEYQAKGGTVIILNPKDGAIMAMCSWPAFDPNKYQQVKDAALFNNPAIFTPYESGSVFKAFTMAGALDAEKVTPETKYFDKGFVQLGDWTIKNAADKSYGEQTMTGVLKESINTGAVFAARLLGHELFRKYVKNFGFGVLTGIELETETSGDISPLEKEKEIYLATASFGQGITTTPLQLVSAFSALANQGKLYKPNLVSEIRYPDGRVEKKGPQFLRQVISPRASRLLAGMLTVVVSEGHGKQAGVPGYYIAGKTGTAQIPSPNGGYLEGATVQTFIGFGPVDDPAFVMLVKYDQPQRRFAEYTAVPTFGEIAKFLLQYLEIPPNK